MARRARPCRARLMEAVARFDRIYSHDYPAGGAGPGQPLFRM